MRPRKERVTRLDYCQYLLVSQINYTLTNYAEHTEKLSHDMANRYLGGDVIRPRLVWENVRDQVIPTPSGLVVFDDTVIYDPPGDGKTKLGHVQDLLQNCVYQKCLPMRAVLMDTWYATKGMMLQLDKFKKIYYCPLKSNRQVDDLGGLKLYTEKIWSFNNHQRENMKHLKEQGIHKLYAQDSEQADWLVWGRKVNPVTRRGFLKNSGLLAMSTVLGTTIPFADQMLGGLIPAALANTDEPFTIPGKEGLIILNDRPVNAETPPHLLDDDITPANRFFIRNNGIPPELETIDPNTWTLEIAGESGQTPTTFTLPQLKQQFQQYTYQLQLECGGNGRSEFNPPASGNQWSVGAVGCAQWTGVRLKDVLQFCGIKEDAVYIGYYGADTHISGDPEKIPISRGVPLAKALEDETLIAWAMNGADLPHLNGYPLRLVCGGWPASTSGKWLKRIDIRNQIHDGPKMGGQSYRVPCQTVAPGTRVPDEDMCIIESMPVKSIITFPQSGIIHQLGTPLAIRGHAWAGDLAVSEVYVSNDFGVKWQAAELKPPVNRLAWQRWQATIDFPQIGYYELWVRAVDNQSHSQPMVLPNWNPRGYLNNATHRIAVQVV